MYTGPAATSARSAGRLSTSTADTFSARQVCPRNGREPIQLCRALSADGPSSAMTPSRRTVRSGPASVRAAARNSSARSIAPGAARPPGAPPALLRARSAASHRLRSAAAPAIWSASLSTACRHVGDRIVRRGIAPQKAGPPCGICTAMSANGAPRAARVAIKVAMPMATILSNGLQTRDLSGRKVRPLALPVVCQRDASRSNSDMLRPCALAAIGLL
mmetsp:Transcript_32606/g.101753  ORF Transcript_32606/g.101753 Transcript_32606/m.101753 type:complete len:218 (+) Transcript_32606:283-936(+)